MGRMGRMVARCADGALLSPPPNQKRSNPARTRYGVEGLSCRRATQHQQGREARVVGEGACAAAEDPQDRRGAGYAWRSGRGAGSGGGHTRCGGECARVEGGYGRGRGRSQAADEGARDAEGSARRAEEDTSGAAGESRAADEGARGMGQSGRGVGEDSSGAEGEPCVVMVSRRPAN